MGDIMNILDFFKKFIYKDSYIKTKNIVPVNDIVKMPSRSDYVGNKEMLDLINEYKDYYKDILYH